MAKLTLDTITSAYQAVPLLNSNNALIETALENTLSLDGTTPNSMSANIDLNSNRVINLAEGIAASDATTYQQVQDLLADASGVDIAGPLAATLVTVADAGGYYDAITVEAALQELFTDRTPIEDGNVNDYMLRWGGTEWVETAALTCSAGGIASVSNRLECEQTPIRFSDGVGNSVDLDFHASGYLELVDNAGTPHFWISTDTRMDHLRFLEKAISSADIATYGQIWIKSDSPQSLMFTNEDGDDILIHASGSFTGTVTGLTTTEQGTVYYERIGSLVTMWIDADISGTSNTTAMTLTGVPAAITPTTQAIGRQVTAVIDNSNAVPSMTTALTTNTIQFSFPDAAWGAGGSFSSIGFTNSGLKGLNVGWTFTYHID